MACLSLFLFALTSPAMSLSPSTTAACLCLSTNSSKLSCTKPLSRTITYNIHVLFSHLTLSTLSLLAALAAAWSAIWFWTCWYTRSLRCSCFLLSDCKHVTCHLSTWNTYGTTCVIKCLHVIKNIHKQLTDESLVSSFGLVMTASSSEACPILYLSTSPFFLDLFYRIINTTFISNFGYLDWLAVWPGSNLPEFKFFWEELIVKLSGYINEMIHYQDALSTTFQIHLINLGCDPYFISQSQ